MKTWGVVARAARSGEEWGGWRQVSPTPDALHEVFSRDSGNT